mmetsp:Transcript_26898/g.85181  ORF Transcript_26898/g.85181 Transcript_26898/m.85181 type:complete len:219 (-) Transcript_26898:612-1268(-)
MLFKGSTGFPSESFNSADAEALDINGEHKDDKGLAASLPGPPESGRRMAATAACCCASRCSLSRQAGSRKTAQAARTLAGPAWGRDFDTLVMILFWIAVARHLMMWSTSKPARHSLICALSRDCASLWRLGVDRSSLHLAPLALGLSVRSPGGGTCRAARAALAPTPQGAEAGAARNSSCLRRSLLASPPASGRAVASGKLIFCASPQSLLVSSKVSL